MIESPDFSKTESGLLPAIIQDSVTHKVLMLGYMNEAAYQKTLSTGKVTFFSRSRQQLWVKGEESGNTLHLVSVAVDCDRDTFLIKVKPEGPVCHTGAETCWNEVNHGDFFDELESIIRMRSQAPAVDSYTTRLIGKGIHKVAQKVGEEAVETVIEAMRADRALFLEESADLIFHWLILCNQMGVSISDIREVLRRRHEIRNPH